MRFFVFVLLVGLNFAFFCRADDVATLESIAAESPTIDAFLADPEKVTRYIAAYARMVGHEGNIHFFNGANQAFDYLRQISAKYPQLGQQAWALVPDWKEDKFEISADSISSGLQFKEGVVAPFLAELQNEWKTQAEGLGLDQASLQQEIDQLWLYYQKNVPLKSPEEMAGFDDLARRQYQNAVSRATADLVKNPDWIRRTGRLASALSLKLFELPPMQKRLSTNIVSSLQTPLKELENLGHAHDLLHANLGLNASHTFWNLLRTKTAAMAAFNKDFENGLKSRDRVGRIKNERLGETALKELLELRHEDPAITEEAMFEKMSPPAKTEYEQWDSLQKAVVEKIDLEQQTYTEQSRFFTYALIEDHDRKTKHLQAAGGAGLNFERSPRAIHAMLMGAVFGECAWAEPRRFFLPAFAGVKIYFTREPSQPRPEGLIRVLPIRLAQKEYRLLESSSHAAKRNIVFEDGENTREFPIYVEFVKRLAKKNSDLVVSDAVNIDSHSRAKLDSLMLHPMYLNGRFIRMEQRPEIADPLAAPFVAEYNGIGNYGNVGILFDGSFDGEHLVELDTAARAPLHSIDWVKEQIYWGRLQGNSFTLEQARAIARDAGYSPEMADAPMQAELGMDEPSRKVLGDAMNDRPGTPEGNYALIQYHLALYRHPDVGELLTTRLLEGIERNTIFNPAKGNPTYQFASAALDRAIAANATEVAKYDDPNWQALIRERAEANPRVLEHLHASGCRGFELLGRR